MKLSELLKRIIDTCNYNEMVIDTELSIEYVCQMVVPLTRKDIDKIQDEIITPLMEQYRITEDTEELHYITETINYILKYIAE